jgi:hypothetical protein
MVMGIGGVNTILHAFQIFFISILASYSYKRYQQQKEKLNYYK